MPAVAGLKSWPLYTRTYLVNSLVLGERIYILLFQIYIKMTSRLYLLSN